jgi:hypothetical protein
LHCRWGKHRSRYGDALIEDHHWVKRSDGSWRAMPHYDNVTEIDYCFRRRERSGWHRGARVLKFARTLNPVP